MKGSSRPKRAAPRQGCGLLQVSAKMKKQNFWLSAISLPSTHLEREIMAIVTVGIDLAKSGFAVHGADESGKLAPVTVRPQIQLC
jgi:hypothetical protein